VVGHHLDILLLVQVLLDKKVCLPQLFLGNLSQVVVLLLDILLVVDVGKLKVGILTSLLIDCFCFSSTLVDFMKLMFLLLLSFLFSLCYCSETCLER